jgi:anti-sigma B factor antagonist
VVVSCAAEMDLTNVSELRKALRTACRAGVVVVVDMSRTVFCDAAAVRALVDAHQRATASNGELRVVVASPALTRILAVMGVDRLLRIVSSLPEALSAGLETNSELSLTRHSGGQIGPTLVPGRRETKASESAVERGVCHVGNLPE